MTADQIPCTDRAQLAWLPPVGMAGGVAEYIPQYREDGGPWISVDTLGVRSCLWCTKARR